jgi:hypothetical protein
MRPFSRVRRAFPLLSDLVSIFSGPLKRHGEFRSTLDGSRSFKGADSLPKERSLLLWGECKRALVHFLLLFLQFENFDFVN